MTWVTNTEISSGRLYRENTLGFFDVKGATVTPQSASSRELYRAPRSWASRPTPTSSTSTDRGNHFAAWKEPDVFTTEIRAACRSLR
jgi:hypothetical protein